MSIERQINDLDDSVRSLTKAVEGLADFGNLLGLFLAQNCKQCDGTGLPVHATLRWSGCYECSNCGPLRNAAEYLKPGY